MSRILSAAVFGALSASLATAQNDECAMALPLLLNTPVAYDTTTATQSALAWTCANGGAPDVWFTFVAGSANDLRFDTCGSSYDTAIEVYTGTCAALVSVACNDLSCGLNSAVTISNVVAGTSYTVRVGGWSGLFGAGTVQVTEVLPPAANCLQTFFASDNGGGPGGAVYFDLTVTQNVSISGISTNASDNVGTPVGLEVYTIPMTYVGNEASMAGWTLAAADDGNTLAAGDDFPTDFTFVSPLVLAPGTYGIALVGNNLATGLMMAHSYTNGTGANQNFMSADGVLSSSHGAASNAPFATPTFSPRVWNGSVCHGAGPIGIHYCNPAVVNSTGNSGVMSAAGSASVANNNLVLGADHLPLNAFGFFLTSQTQGNVANPGGSQGNLCLGGAIGRYVGPGQIQNTGATGSIALAVNLSLHPTPTGLVQVAVGETWNFQAWHRDVVAGSATSNFTDGLEITFL